MSRFFHNVVCPFFFAVFIASSILFVILSFSVMAGAKAHAAELNLSQQWDMMNENMGILYFHKPGCSYCLQQKAIFDEFQKATGFQNIIGIDITERQDLAAQYGVSTVPDVWVVGQIGKNFRQRRISSGLINANEIYQMLEESFRVWFSQTETMSGPSLSVVKKGNKEQEAARVCG